MANAYTDTSGSSLGTSLVQTAYDRYVEMALRPQTLIRAVADKRPVQVDKPGSSVVLQTYGDLAPVTSALTETTDPDAVAVGNTSTVTVTLNEYGLASLVTRKLELFALSDVDPAIADIIAYNMADSLDGLAMTELRGGTNVFRSDAGAYSTQALNLLAAGDDFKSALARRAVTELRAGNALPKRDELFWCGIHPRVSADLRSESGAASWRIPHEYNSNNNIWNGEIGIFEGAFYVESNRLYKNTDGASSATVFRTIYAGAQALAEAVAEEPHTVIGPVTDKLNRFRPIGWYGVLGWKRFREGCIQRVETTASSLA